jgi:hypothetical protein
MAQLRIHLKDRFVGAPALVGALSGGLLLLVLAAGNAVAGQPTPAPWHVVQGSDGSVYVLKDGGRYTLQADAITDDDLQAFPDLGPLGPLLEPAVVVAPTPTPIAIRTPFESGPGVPSAPSAPTVDTSGSGALGAFGTPTPIPTPIGAPQTYPLPSTGAPSTTRPGTTFPPGAVPPLVTTPVAPPVAPAPVVAEAPVVYSGLGAASTRAFPLRGGNYTVLWSASTSSAAPDNFAAFLRPIDPSNPHAQVITAVLVPGGRSVSGQAQVLNLPAGNYFLELITASSWNISITAQPGGA